MKVHFLLIALLEEFAMINADSPKVITLINSPKRRVQPLSIFTSAINHGQNVFLHFLAKPCVRPHIRMGSEIQPYAVLGAVNQALIF